MVAGRDPIDRIVDLVVAVPLCSALAARESVALVARLARAQLVTPATEVVEETDDSTAPEPQPPRTASVAASVPQPKVALDDDLPIDGYDQLAARQVVDRLETLDDDDLAVVERYELAHRHRSTVLGRIAQLRS